MKTKLFSHNALRCALPLAAAFLLPSVALAATNLPPPDAGQIGEAAQQNALKSHLPVTEGGAESATFRLARITVTQDGTQLYDIPLTGHTGTEDIPIADAHGENTIRIEGESIAVVHADCPDQVCVRTGRAEKKGDVIACLPHKLLIEVK